ncbi:hypothetical protein DL771_006446 [Monosporascus sp. 5C6A]|nr:hypothetical protein DL771_006446 [Monosporascus sp. 5C6A]
MAHPHPPQQGGHVNRQFPLAFYLYSTGLGGRKYVLGEHKNQPLYAVTTHAGWSGKADTVLHSGPSPDAPPLATANGGNTVVSSVDVDITGATGVLGERWAVMAVITALRMWDREAKKRGGAAGGSMAGLS